MKPSQRNARATARHNLCDLSVRQDPVREYVWCSYSRRLIEAFDMPDIRRSPILNPWHGQAIRMHTVIGSCSGEDRR